MFNFGCRQFGSSFLSFDSKHMPAQQYIITIPNPKTDFVAFMLCVHMTLFLYHVSYAIARWHARVSIRHMQPEAVTKPTWQGAGVAYN